MADFCGKWELVSTDDNFDKYMEVTGVSEDKRKLARTVLCDKLTQEISRDGTTWKLKVSSSAGERSFEYPEGQSVDVTTLDGRKVKVVYTLEGNQLVESMTGDGFTARNLRAVSGETLTMTLSSGGVSSVRTYKKAA